MPAKSWEILDAYVRDRYNLALGPRTGFDVVDHLLRRVSGHEDMRVEVRGRDLTSSSPRTIVLSKTEIRDAVRAWP